MKREPRWKKRYCTGVSSDILNQRFRGNKTVQRMQPNKWSASRSRGGGYINALGALAHTQVYS